MTYDQWVEKILDIKTIAGCKEAARVINEEIALCDSAISAASGQRALYDEEGGADAVKRGMLETEIRLMIDNRADLANALRVIHDHTRFIDCRMDFE